MFEQALKDKTLFLNKNHYPTQEDQSGIITHLFMGPNHLSGVFL